MQVRMEPKLFIAYTFVLFRERERERERSLMQVRMKPKLFIAYAFVLFREREREITYTSQDGVFHHKLV